MFTSWLHDVLLTITGWLQDLIGRLSSLAPEGTLYSLTFNVKGLLAILLVSLICGAVGSLVVGNRMAFFSDALAHCAFAGVGLGVLLALLSGASEEKEFYGWVMPIMIGFGFLVGLGIAFVREKTSLASDTVIGVFFAGAMGFGAMILKPLSRRTYFHPENFLFGDLLTLDELDLFFLILLALLTAVLLVCMYNSMVFASFNPSLARSRQIRVRLHSYVFILLLALIVNLCLKIVGALLINALLIVPAATASLLGRNMRQVFWLTILLCLVVGVGGQYLSWEIAIPDPSPPGRPLHFGTSGVIVVLSVILFFASMFWVYWGSQGLRRLSAWLRGRRAA
jgi:zinc transport system permease protein